MSLIMQQETSLVTCIGSCDELHSKTKRGCGEFVLFGQVTL